MFAAIDRVNRAHPWSHNDHYLRWVLRQVPAGARRALDVGCGTGSLARGLARVVPAVDAVDRSAAALALARPAPGVTFSVADVLELPAMPGYDLVTAVAVLHHLPDAAWAHLGAMVRPGGRLVVVGCHRRVGRELLLDLVAVPANLLVGLARSRRADAARVAMSAPVVPAGATLAEIRAVAGAALGSVRVRRRLFWRYTLTWTR